MNEDNNSERQSLYDEFELEVVKNGNTEAYFDEDELIEIFDYASDLDNNIVKMEVLIYGAVHFPKSDRLATRRAWFYFALGEVEATNDLNNRIPGAGVLNRILALKAQQFDDENGGATEDPDIQQVEKNLEEILLSTTDFTDEEIIQFVDYAMECGASDWLLRNKNRIVERCSYPPTFLYEFASGAEDELDLATAALLFEELTMLEPFTADFWERLAYVQISQQQYAQALSSAEYALAITPDSANARRLKGKALFHLGGKPQEIIDLVSPLLEDPTAVQESDISALVSAYVDLERIDEARQLLRQYIPRFTYSHLLLDLLLVIDPDAAEPFLEEAFFGPMPMEEEDVTTWVRLHIGSGQFGAAARIVLAYHRLVGFKKEIPFFIEVLYFGLQFQRIIEIHDTEVVKNPDYFVGQPQVELPYIMSLIRLGKPAKALDAAKTVRSSLLSMLKKMCAADMNMKLGLTPALSHTIIHGLVHTLDNIIKALSAPEPLPVDDYDPMIN